MTNEREVLRDTVRTLLTREGDTRTAMTSSSGYDEKLWSRLCALGAAGLHVPDDLGGSGASFLETAVVLAELGRSLTPSPLLGSVLASSALPRAGADPLLREIADGSAVPSLVWGPYALNAQVADVFLAVRDGELYAVPPADVDITPLAPVDPTRRLATVSVRGAGTSLGPVDESRLRDVALAALAAESAGAAARCLELTVSYAGQRTQFGRPIGSFQALKHRMADMHLLVETAESAALAAATAVADGVDLSSTTATAAVWCTEAFTRVAAEMIQLHGGVAITWEHDAHLYFKRAHGNAHLFGSPREHVARLATQLG
ncbi:acyl-CoA dehydrogenase family protein [Actinophytocola oryzae]